MNLITQKERMEIQLDTLYNMDCLEGMKHIPDGSVDAIICDLPYGTTRNQWDSIIPLPELWQHYKRIIKPNGAIVLFAQTPFDKVLGASNIQMLKYEWIWKKTRATGFLNAKYAPRKIHENILVFYTERPTYNPQFTEGAPYVSHCNSHSGNYGDMAGTTIVNEGKRFPIDIYECTSEMDGWHPTQKPVDLLRYLVLAYTNPGDTVLDNCMGSGTTAIACIREHRHFIGFEMNTEYYTKALQRIDIERRTPSLF